MFSLNTMTAASLTIEIAGETFRLTPLSLADYGEIALTLHNPCSVVNRELAAAETSVDALATWMSTPAGMSHVLWLVARRGQPGLTLHRCREIVAAMQDLEELGRQLDLVNGLPVGNCQGQARLQQPRRSAA